MLETRLKTVGIDHTVLHVSDLERSRRFYIDLLGMTVAHGSSWNAFPLVWGAAGGEDG